MINPFFVMHGAGRDCTRQPSTDDSQKIAFLIICTYNLFYKQLFLLFNLLGDDVKVQKPANTTHPIHELLKNRWSPKAYSSQPITKDTLLSLFEAARWSPSSSNLQPWSFIVATHNDMKAFDRLLCTLDEGNQVWAGKAPVLVLTISQRDRKPGTPNRHAGYDLGQAVAHLTVQAGAYGLALRQMGGFDGERARRNFNLPDGFDPMTVLAIGYPGEPESLPEDLRERELAPRKRKPLEEFVFDGAWQKPLEESAPLRVN